MPLAADADRGWLLLPDGGTTLRAAQGGQTDLAHWERVLVEYAEMQRLLCPARGRDGRARRARPATGGLARVISPTCWPTNAVLLIDRAGRAHVAEQLARLRAGAGPASRGWCDELAATGVPASLQHDDLHDANVFVPDDGVGLYRVFDWGDASVAHPFATLLVTLRVVADRLGLANGAPRAAPVARRLRRAMDRRARPGHSRRGLPAGPAHGPAQPGPVLAAITARRHALGARPPRRRECPAGWSTSACRRSLDPAR